MAEEEKQKVEDFEPAYDESSDESSDDTAMLRAVLQSDHARNITPVSVYRQPDFDGTED